MNNETKELLVELTIPLYIREYVKSKSIRAKYYRKGDVIPTKFSKQQDLYAWRAFSVIEDGKKVNVDFLVDKASGNKIISNPHLVGTEKRININGQGIYNGNIQRQDRNNMIGQIKDSFRKEIQSLSPITRFPIRIDVYLFDTIIDDHFSNGQDWDLDNRFFPYGKSFADELKKQHKIPEDNRYYITEPPHAIFVPVPDIEDRKLVVKIYKDNRPCILNNYLYKKHHGDRIK
jgi:hypothetical protein